MLKKHVMTWLASVMVLVTITIPVSDKANNHQLHRVPLLQEQKLIDPASIPNYSPGKLSPSAPRGEQGQRKELEESASDDAESHSMRALDFGNLTHPGPDGSKTSQPQMYFLCYMNDRWKAMLLHIPKNAGSSVAENLADIFCAATENATCDTKEQRMKHFKISEKCVKNPSYFSFAFTRNPWDRAVSFWSYGLKRRQLAVKDLKKRKELAAKYCSFRQFLFNKGRGGCGYHTEYEQYPLIYDSKGRPGLNFLGRVEHFQRDFQAILMRIDPTGKLLAVYRKLGFVMHNDSGHRPYQDYYSDDEMKTRVTAKWPQDVKLGYTFNFTGVKMNITTYADGKPAAELMFGDVA